MTDHLDQYCLNFLDATNRPFDYHDDGRVPDGYPQNTTKLMDYYDSTPFSLPVTSGATTSVSGVGFMLLVGVNSVSSSLGFVGSGTSYTGTPLYGYAFFGLNSSGGIVTVTLTLNEDGYKHEDEFVSKFTSLGVKPNVRHQSVKSVSSYDAKSQFDEKEQLGVTAQTWWTNGSVNYNTIFGTTTGVSYDTDGLAANFRVISAGMRLWPTIEVVTDSSTLHVVKYYGCQMTPVQMTRINTLGSSVYTVMKECPEFFETHNSAGISARVQVCQEGPLKLTEVNALMNWNNATFSTGNMFFPVVIAQLSQAISWTTTATVCPFNFMYRITIEAVLETPTPILSSRPPLSHDWHQLLKTMAYDTDKYPTITEGHSFKKVMYKTGKGLASMNPITKKAFKVGEMAVKAGKKINKARKMVKQGRGVSAALEMARAAGINTNGRFRPSEMFAQGAQRLGISRKYSQGLYNIGAGAYKSYRRRRPRRNTAFGTNRMRNAANSRFSQENRMNKSGDISIRRRR